MYKREPKCTFFVPTFKLPISNEIYFHADNYTLIAHWEHISYLKEHQEHFEISIDYVDAKKLLPFIQLMNDYLYVSVDGAHKVKFTTLTTEILRLLKPQIR